MLRVSKVPPGDPSTEDYVGQNRFECLTCPYQFVINKRYYERKYMKKKEVEDILGGKGAWDNVDKTEGRAIPRAEVMIWGRWLTREQCNARMKSVVMTRRIGISCRLGVLMSL
jgi:hypothetical protein